MEQLVDQHEQALSKLQGEHNKSLNELEERERRSKEAEHKYKQNMAKIRDLHRELETKNDLVCICQ